MKRIRVRPRIKVLTRVNNDCPAPGSENPPKETPGPAVLKGVFNLDKAADAFERYCCVPELFALWSIIFIAELVFAFLTHPSFANISYAIAYYGLWIILGSTVYAVFIALALFVATWIVWGFFALAYNCRIYWHVAILLMVFLIWWVVFVLAHSVADTTELAPWGNGDTKAIIIIGCAIFAYGVIACLGYRDRRHAQCA